MAQDTTQLRPPTLTEMVSLAIQTHTPAILWGPPGVGKTSVVAAVSQALSIHQETIISSLRDPTDFGGLPYIHEGAVHLASPAWAKRLHAIGNEALSGPPIKHRLAGLAFFDEITSTPPAVQAALLRVVLEGVVGDTQLPPNIAMLAAANPPDQAAGGWDLALPLMNRFMHIQWEIDRVKWADGFTNGWPMQDELALLPPEWEASIPATKLQVAQFIKNSPDVLLMIPKDNKQNAFPTPRSWDMLSRILTAADLLGLQGDKFASSIIGTGVGLQFLAWRSTRQFQLDATSAMQGSNTYMAQIAAAPLDSIAAFNDAIIHHVVSSSMSKASITRAWHILYEVWQLRGKKTDSVYKAAFKLATTSPTPPQDAFSSKGETTSSKGETTNAKHVEFLTAVINALQAHHGIVLK